MATTELGLDENIEGALAYVLGIVTGLVFFLVEKDNKFVRFHGMQSIMLSAALIGLGIILMILSAIVSAIPVIGWVAGILMMLVSPLVYLAGLVIAVLLIVKAYQGERYKLPVIGNMAEKHI